MAERAADNGRGAPRVPVSMLVQYRFDTLEDFAAEYAVDLSTTGIFVQSDQPQKVGSMVYLQITLKDGSKLIEGFGRVARVGQDSRGQEGMGIQFISFDDESMELIEKLVAARLESEG
jgi:uncharacterized protein (TIGR02266 family)